MGREVARHLPFETPREWIRAALAEAAEATCPSADGRALQVGDVDDVSEAVECARIGSVLSLAELLSVGQMLAAARELLRAGSRRRLGRPRARSHLQHLIGCRAETKVIRRDWSGGPK
jgi:dsDNA-specific endonuclease/ATPase MutS2